MWRKDVKAASILSPTTQDDHYWYDGLRQVTRHDRGSLTPAGGPPYTGVGNLQQQEDWTYDETGNWKQYQSFAPSLVQTREHNVANQITDIVDPSGVVQPVFDPAGNMRTMPAPGNWTKAYTCKWDAWNRLVEIRDGSTLVQANSYDARTRRIRKQNATETRDYYYDRQWRALEERVSGAIQADYVYSPTDRWNLIRRRRSVSGTLNETRFVLRDYLDPVAIITAAGVVDERYGYEAFGPVRVMDANFATRSSSTCAWNWLYHGEFLDGESGMYDYGYRFYHPALGRWASRDPIGERGGVNLYGFVGNDGLSRRDHRGLAVVSIEPILDSVEKVLKKIDPQKPPSSKKIVTDIVDQIPKEYIDELKKIDCTCIEEPLLTVLRALGMCDGISGEVLPFLEISGIIDPGISVEDGINPKLKIIGVVKDLPFLPGSKGTAEVNIDSDGEAKGRLGVNFPITNGENPFIISGIFDLPSGDGKATISKKFPDDGGELRAELIIPSDNRNKGLTVTFGFNWNW